MVFTLLFLLSAVYAEWPMPRHDAQHSGSSDVASLNGSQTTWRVWLNNSNPVEGVSISGTDIWLTNAGKLYHLTTSGSVQKFVSGNFTASPSMENNIIYVTAADEIINNLYHITALKTEDLTTVWTFPINSTDIVPPFVVYNGVTYAFSDTDEQEKLVAIDTTGHEKWTHLCASPVPAYTPPPATVTPNGEVLAICVQTLVALNAATGAQVWNLSVDASITGFVAVSGDMAIVPIIGSMVGVNLTTHKQQWRVSTLSWSPCYTCSFGSPSFGPVEGGSRLVFAPILYPSYTVIVAVDLVTGTTKWDVELSEGPWGHTVLSSSLAVTNDCKLHALGFTTHPGHFVNAYVYQFDGRTGKLTFASHIGVGDAFRESTDLSVAPSLLVGAISATLYGFGVGPAQPLPPAPINPTIEPDHHDAILLGSAGAALFGVLTVLLVVQIIKRRRLAYDTLEPKPLPPQEL